MLSACATAGKPALPGTTPIPDPIVQDHYRTEYLCPPELEEDLGPEPALPDDAVIQHNDAGGAWLDAKIQRGQRAVDLFTDARAWCREAKAEAEANP